MSYTMPYECCKLNLVFYILVVFLIKQLNKIQLHLLDMR